MGRWKWALTCEPQPLPNNKNLSLVLSSGFLNFQAIEVVKMSSFNFSRHHRYAGPSITFNEIHFIIFWSYYSCVKMQDFGIYCDKWVLTPKHPSPGMSFHLHPFCQGVRISLLLFLVFFIWFVIPTLSYAYQRYYYQVFIVTLYDLLYCLAAIVDESLIHTTCCNKCMGVFLLL